MYELYELSPDDFDGTLDHWLTFIHPDDVPEVLRRYELGVQETSIFSMDVRIRRQHSGAMRHIRSLAKLSRDEGGAPLRAVGMNWDITDHIDLAQAVFEEKERLRITLHSIGDSVISTDAQARITFMNPVAEQMTGWLASEAAGMPLRDVFRIVDEQTGDPIPRPGRNLSRPATTILSQRRGDTDRARRRASQRPRFSCSGAHGFRRDHWCRTGVSGRDQGPHAAAGTGTFG
ncbi:PAS domain-containing protein [Mesorhizobium sp. UC22_110]|uniref:PAS domain-containing protein n=1 Tax=Mesorhizobium sp. UC22_110 TaxID=3374552 RepID=UPI003756B0E3